jgi:hypothetical protein
MKRHFDRHAHFVACDKNALPRRPATCSFRSPEFLGDFPLIHTSPLGLKVINMLGGFSDVTALFLGEAICTDALDIACVTGQTQNPQS